MGEREKNIQYENETQHWFSKASLLSNFREDSKEDGEEEEGEEDDELWFQQQNCVFLLNFYWDVKGREREKERE